MFGASLLLRNIKHVVNVFWRIDSHARYAVFFAVFFSSKIKCFFPKLIFGCYLLISYCSWCCLDWNVISDEMWYCNLENFQKWI